MNYEIIQVNQIAKTRRELETIVMPLEDPASEYVYIIKFPGGISKIGMTAQLFNRMLWYFAAKSKEIELLYIIKTSFALELERQMQAYLSSKIEQPNRSEYYILDETEINNLIDIAKSFESVEIDRYQREQYFIEQNRFRSLMMSGSLFARADKKQRNPRAPDLHLPFIARLDSTYRLRIPKEIVTTKNPPRGKYYNVVIEEIDA